MTDAEAAAGRAIDLLAAPSGEGDLATVLDLLHRADAAGSGRAAHQLAVLAATGVGAAADWPRALAMLARSAGLGFAPAQGQLRLLAGEGGDWDAMSRRIDLAAWMAPPDKRRVCESPRLRAIDGFVAPAICDWLVGMARGRLAPAHTYGDSGEARRESGRTNTEADFNIAQGDVVLALVRQRVSAAIGLPTAAMELTKVLHYDPGQAFNRHFDCLDPSLEGHRAEIDRRGQRIVTFLLYLNDDYEGGETEFVVPGLQLKGKKGDALFFANVDLAGAPDSASLHQGRPPTRGEKWLLSQWVRNRSQ